MSTWIALARDAKECEFDAARCAVSMTTFDWVVVLVIGLSTLLAFFRGVVRELIAAVAWVLGFVGAIAFTPVLGAMLPAIPGYPAVPLPGRIRADRHRRAAGGRADRLAADEGGSRGGAGLRRSLPRLDIRLRARRRADARVRHRRRADAVAAHRLVAARSARAAARCRRRRVDAVAARRLARRLDYSPARDARSCAGRSRRDRANPPVTSGRLTCAASSASSRTRRSTSCSTTACCCCSIAARTPPASSRAKAPMFHMHKGRGMVRDVFRTRNMRELPGNVGIGQCRYPTAGSAFSEPRRSRSTSTRRSASTLGHNGNLTNSEALKRELFRARPPPHQHRLRLRGAAQRARARARARRAASPARSRRDLRRGRRRAPALPRRLRGRGDDRRLRPARVPRSVRHPAADHRRATRRWAAPSTWSRRESVALDALGFSRAARRRARRGDLHRPDGQLPRAAVRRATRRSTRASSSTSTSRGPTR